MTASQKRMTFMALLSAQAERAALDETILVLTRYLADAHGIPASYPLPNE